MKRLFTLFCLFVVGLTGCSSKKEEVAIVPTQAAPAVQANHDTDSSDSSMSDDGSNSTDDGSSEETDDGSDSGEEDSSMTDDSTGDDGTMAESEESMTDDDGSGAAVVALKPKNLREQADQAFGDGLEKAAYRLIQAHTLASTADASELLAHYRWSPARKQPQMGVRIAIGVELTSPSELKDYKPVGSLTGFFSKRKPASRSRIEAVADDESGEGNTAVMMLPANSKERILQKYAGMMGDVIVDHVRLGHSEGKWAPVFQSHEGVAITARPIANSEDGSDDGSGDDGSGNMMASAPKWPLATRIEGQEAKYISLGPILTYIGRGTTAELLEQAKTGEFDALIVFDVDVTVNTKLRLIYNSCRAKMLNIADGKSIAASKLLKNTDAQKEIDKSGRAYVVTAMQPILTKLDELVALQAIPSALTPEIIKTKRLVTLVTDESRSKLESVTEIRLWREKALLEDADVLAAYESLLGAEDGRVLASGTDEERLAVVTKLLAGN